MLRMLATSLLIAAPLLAQERPRPYLRGAFGFAGGSFSFDDDSPTFDDRAPAALFSLEFEGTTRRGIGGGLRFEGLITDDDQDEALFRDTTDPNDFGFEARTSTLFAHFTYRIEQHRFAMPVRIGLLANGLVLEDQNTDNETTYASLGPCLEFEPEVTLVHRGGFACSVYGQFGVGVAATVIDIDGDSENYTSTTAFVNVEAGVRLRYRFAELGMSYIGRFQSMDDSDVENGFFVPAYDAAFQGVFFTFGVSF